MPRKFSRCSEGLFEMRKYYHIYPTCPQCFEPHIKGSALVKIDNDLLMCSSCKAYFSNRVDLISSQKFSKTVEAVQRSVETIFKDEKKKADDIIGNINKIHLPWKVETNIIEDTYIEWLKEVNSGKFLIIWPWREVKFLPILISEYLLNNPDKKMAVVGDIDRESDQGEIKKPAIDTVFNNLCFLKEREPYDINSEIRKEMKKFNSKFIFHKEKVIDYVIRLIGSGPYEREDICIDSLTKCKNRVVKDIESVSGENSIRKLKIKKNENVEPIEETLNDGGFIDLKFVERQQYLGKFLKYNKEWLWDVLMNLKNFRCLKKIIDQKTINDAEDTRLLNERLLFISTEMEPQKIFNVLDSFRPNLIIIQDVDHFIKDIQFTGRKSMMLFEFLNKSNDSLIFLFSTDPEIRYYYGINHSNENIAYAGVINYNVVPHTWDYEGILKKIRELSKDKNSQYSTPVSSNVEELPINENYPEFEYICIEALDELDILYEELEPFFEGNLKRDVSVYINNLKKTPLLIIGDYSKPEFFNITGKNSNYKLTYEYLVSKIQEQNNADNNKFSKIKNLIEKIFGTTENPRNLILEKMIEKISEVIKNQNSNITIVVHKYEVKGVEKLLKNSGFDKYIHSKLNVSSWCDLSERLLKSDKNDIYYIISTLPPQCGFHLSSSTVSKIIFIGGQRFIEKIKNIIKYRIDEQMRRPLYLLSEKDPAPDLLKKLQKDIEFQSNKSIQDLIVETTAEFGEGMTRMPSPIGKYEEYHRTIKSGDIAVLVINADKKGAFLPDGASLLTIFEGKLSEFKIDELSLDNTIENLLKGKELLLQKQELYVSFRADFTKYMSIYGNGVEFKRGPFVWKGFDKLFRDSNLWIEDIIRAISEYSKSKNISNEDGEDCVSKIFSSLNLTAKDPNYIKNWWSRYEVISTERGIYRLNRIEHPKSPDDLVKIYKWIADNLPALNINQEYARKSYYASFVIQHFRTTLLKGEIEEISPSLRGLYALMEDKIKELVDMSEKFKVEYVHKVKIIKDVEPFIVMDKFDIYVEK